MHLRQHRMMVLIYPSCANNGKIFGSKTASATRQQAGRRATLDQPAAFALGLRRELADRHVLIMRRRNGLMASSLMGNPSSQNGKPRRAILLAVS